MLSSSSRDNWERLVSAVVKREQIWQLCHKPYSRSPSISTTSSDTPSNLSQQFLNYSSLEVELEHIFLSSSRPQLPQPEPSLSQGQTLQSIVNDRKKAFQRFYDANVPDTVEVQPPDVIKTKGSGSRLISRQEKAAKMLLKPKRRCAKCKEMAYHDARNCDKVSKKKTKV